MKKNVSNVPKLKIEAINCRSSFVAMMINAITTPLINTALVGTPFFEILASIKTYECEKYTLMPTSKLFVPDASFIPFRFMSVRTRGIATATIIVTF